MSTFRSMRPVDAGFGGPVWHVSVSRGTAQAQRLKALAILFGRGDSARGEWWEVGHLATHLRRRLSADEEVLVGPAVDIRGDARTVEAIAARMAPYLPEGFPVE